MIKADQSEPSISVTMALVALSDFKSERGLWISGKKVNKFKDIQTQG